MTGHIKYWIVAKARKSPRLGYNMTLPTCLCYYRCRVPGMAHVHHGTLKSGNHRLVCIRLDVIKQKLQIFFVAGVNDRDNWYTLTQLAEELEG